MKAIASLGDLHCGSIYGLLPPNFIASDEREVPQNFVQKFLWECYDSYWEQVAKYPVAAVVWNGDMVDGLGPKVRGGEQCLTREVDQVLAAEQCIQHAMGKFKFSRPKLYMVAGTDYHVGILGREEEALARAVGAEAYRGEGAGQRIKEVLNLSVEGVHGNFAHHVSFAPVNKTMPLEKELQGALMAELDNYPKVDYLIRNHVHYYRSVGAGYRHGATSPCWQLATKFGRKGGVFKFRPDIGGLVVWVNGKDKEAGDDPVRIQPILFKSPVNAVEVVTL